MSNWHRKRLDINCKNNDHKLQYQVASRTDEMNYNVHNGI